MSDSRILGLGGFDSRAAKATPISGQNGAGGPPWIIIVSAILYDETSYRASEPPVGEARDYLQSGRAGVPCKDSYEIGRRHTQ